MAYRERRRALMEQLEGRAVILCNGWERPRNYLANAYPFRGESHFLYFFGSMPPGAVGLITPEESLVFLEPVTLDDAVWSGPGADWSALEAQAGVKVRPMDELRPSVEKIGAEHCAGLFPQDPCSQRLLRALLGRMPAFRTNAADLSLAQAVVKLRLHHDEAAVAELRRAGMVSVQAHLQGIAHTRPGLSECDINAVMQGECLKNGMTTSFLPIISVHGERLHQPYIGNKLEDGDMLLADFGAETALGWAGDITNTWPVNGRYSAEQRGLYEAVWEAHRVCAAMLRPGVDYMEVHKAAYATLSRGLRDLGVLKVSPEEAWENNLTALFFPHGIGHLLGLDVHDMEDLGDLAGYPEGRSRLPRFGESCLRLGRVLEPGMALTIEPGLYFIPEVLDDPANRLKSGVNWDLVDKLRRVRGIRIERDYLILPAGGAQGAENLTPGMPNTVEEMEQMIGSQA